MPAVQAQARGTASLLIRFGAKVFDGLIVGIPLAILFSIFGISTTWISGVVQAVVFVGYLTYMESTTGATVGKRILGLTVVDETGNPPSQQDAFKRNLYGLVGIVPLIGWILSLGAVIGIAVTIATDEHDRGFHDKLAGTGVMRS